VVTSPRDLPSDIPWKSREEVTRLIEAKLKKMGAAKKTSVQLINCPHEVLTEVLKEYWDAGWHTKVDRRTNDQALHNPKVSSLNYHVTFSRK
jgi:hypothetical protein